MRNAFSFAFEPLTMGSTELKGPVAASGEMLARKNGADLQKGAGTEMKQWRLRLWLKLDVRFF